MQPARQHLLSMYLSKHAGVIDRTTAVGLGISEDQLDWAVRSGRLEVVHRGVYRSPETVLTPTGTLRAACLAAGAGVGSHRSAAQLWGIAEQPPDQPDVTVPHSRRVRVPGIVVHRSTDLDRSRVVLHEGVQLTDPARTLVDLAGVVADSQLDDAIDRALAQRLVAVATLETEALRLSRQGRPGPATLRRALHRRGLIESPEPSVLESRVLRLLHAWGVEPIGTEVAVLDGRYRLDFLLRPDLALEVDGFAFHSSPEAKAADAIRRNELLLAGIRVIQSDWVTVVRRPGLLRQQVQRALLDAADGRQPVDGPSAA